MRRTGLIACLAFIVMLPLANAIGGIAMAVESSTLDAWLSAGLDMLQAAITLMLALGILAIVDDPRTSRPLWLLSTSYLLRRRLVKRQAPTSTRNA